MARSLQRSYRKFHKQPAPLAIAKKICRIAREWPETISIEIDNVVLLAKRGREVVRFIPGQDYFRIKVLGREGIQEIKLFTNEPDIIRQKLVIACRRELSVPFYFGE